MEENTASIPVLDSGFKDAKIQRYNDAPDDSQRESTQVVQQGETSEESQQQMPDITDKEEVVEQTSYVDEQTTAFRENPMMGSSCYVPTVGGTYAATLEGNYGSSQDKDDWWPPGMMQDGHDSALEELQAIASALEETYTQVPSHCTTENPHKSEAEAHIKILDQEIPMMKLLF